MTDWRPDLRRSDAPRYIAIADSIAADLSNGRLSPGDRLPAQRRLAEILGLDFTTVARGYTEARRRGLLSSQVGSGTFVADPNGARGGASAEAGTSRACPPDFSMNLPPEPNDPALATKMQASYSALASDLMPLLRYQTLETSEKDQLAAARWLEATGLAPDPSQILFASGAQAALNHILAATTEPGDQIACEDITYPGIRSLAAQLGLELVALETDDAGILPDSLKSAIGTGRLKALYLNPTIQNPTTKTIPYHRRKELADCVETGDIAILEDDAYGQLCRKAPLPFAALAPASTWYIGSLSKTLGAGLRLAYVLAPSTGARWQFARTVRTAQVMPSPIMTALATRWIEDGTAFLLLDHIRSESAARQQLAARHLHRQDYLADPEGFHLWLELSGGWTRSALVSQLRNLPIGITEADAFTVSGTPAEHVRIGLGGPADRAQLAQALDVLAQTLDTSPARSSVYF
ncbi:MAG: PLP-dependent aminotransferase family protein [Pseudomonadota bacterium]